MKFSDKAFLKYWKNTLKDRDNLDENPSSSTQPNDREEPKIESGFSAHLKPVFSVRQSQPQNVFSTGNNASNWKLGGDRSIVINNPSNNWSDIITRPINTQGNNPLFNLPHFIKYSDYKGVIQISPVLNTGEVIHAANFTLFPDKKSKKAYFIRSKPILSNCQLIVMKDAFHKIIGGTLSLGFSVFWEGSAQELLKLEGIWKEILEQGKYRPKNWKFEPLNLNRIESNLEITDLHLVNKPVIVNNADYGTVECYLELSEIGVSLWQKALKENRPELIHGIISVTSFYYSHNKKRARVEELQHKELLDNLLGRFGEESVMNLPEAQTTQVHVNVVGDPKVEQTLINYKVSNSLQTATFTLNSDGGNAYIPVSSTNLDTVQLEWSALISYKDSRWPVIKLEGLETISDSLWSIFVKPSSYVKRFKIYFVFFDNQENVISPEEWIAEVIHGELIVEADYLTSRLIMHFPIERSEQLIDIDFPIPPEESPKSISIRIFYQGKIFKKNLPLEPELISVEIRPSEDLRILILRDVLVETTENLSYLPRGVHKFLNGR